MTIADLVFFDEHQAEFEESVTAAEKCLRGRPLQRSWHHFTSSDGKFQAGDNFVIPAGFGGQWEVLETTRKIYVICQP